MFWVPLFTPPPPGGRRRGRGSVPAPGAPPLDGTQNSPPPGGGPTLAPGTMAGAYSSAPLRVWVAAWVAKSARLIGARPINGLGAKLD